MLPLIREGKEAELGEAAGSHRSPVSPRRSCSLLSGWVPGVPAPAGASPTPPLLVAGPVTRVARSGETPKEEFYVWPP